MSTSHDRKWLWNSWTRLRTVVALTTIVGAGCTGAERPDGETESSGPQAAQLLQQLPVEALRGDAQDMTVTSAAFIADDQVVAVDRNRPGIYGIRLTDSSSRQWGRSGGGPGEYTAPFWIGRCGSETVHVFDGRGNRVLIYSDSGAFLSAFQPPIEAVVAACSADGYIGTLLRPDNLGMPGASGKQGKADLLLLGAAGDTVARLGPFRTGENRPLAGIFRFAVLDSARFVIGVGDQARISIVRAPAETIHTIEIPVETRVVDSVHYSAAIESQLAFYRTEDDRAPLRQLMWRIPPPTTLPYFRKIVAGHDGTIVLDASNAGDTTMTLLVGTVNGSWRHYQLPYKDELLDVRGTRVLVLTRDTKGIDVLEVWSLGGQNVR